MYIKKNFLNEYFISNELEFFNVNFLKDSNFFIDPLFVFNSDIPEFKDSRDIVIDFFVHISEMESESKAEKALKIKEPSENRLGFSKNIKGRGIGKIKANQIFDNIIGIKKIIDLSKFRGHFEGFFIFGNNIGADNISDFIFNILKKSFVNYTIRMIKENPNSFNLIDQKPIENCGFSIEKNRWERLHFNGLPKDENILFIPNVFLTQGLFVSKKNYNNFLYTLENEKIRELFNYEIISEIEKKIAKKIRENEQLALENKKQISINHKTIRRELIKNNLFGKPNAISVFIEKINTAEIDHGFIYRENNKNEIIQSILPDVQIFLENNKSFDGIEFFKIFLKSFSSLLKINKKLNETLSDEKIMQDFIEFAFSFFNIINENIKFYREVKIGNGSVDFLLSFTTTGTKEIKELPIELKLCSNPNWKVGIFQTSAYIERFNSSKGIFLIAVNNDEQLQKVEKWKQTIISDKVEIIILDLILLTSPSKLKS